MHDKNQDETRPITDFVLPSQKYKLLQNAYRNLRDELERWNIEALTEGAEKKPYEQEVVDLNRMINWGERELMNASFSINVKGISIRSLRYAKTALLFFLATKNKEVQKKRQEGWPERVVNSLGETTIEVKEIEQKIEYTPFDFLPDLIPNYTPNYTPKSNSLKWDVLSAMHLKIRMSLFDLLHTLYSPAG